MIPPLSAEDVPAEAAALKAELVERLPFASIASLLVELDHHTGFLDCFTHGGGKQSHSSTRSSELKRNLLAVLIASVIFSRAKRRLPDQQHCVVHGVRDVLWAGVWGQRQADRLLSNRCQLRCQLRRARPAPAPVTG